MLDSKANHVSFGTSPERETHHVLAVELEIRKGGTYLPSQQSFPIENPWWEKDNANKRLTTRGQRVSKKVSLSIHITTTFLYSIACWQVVNSASRAS